MSNNLNNVEHFSINADDVPRARRFYEGVFHWQFTPWGPPNSISLRLELTRSQVFHGALQGRREIVKGKPTFGFECTIGVASVDETAAAVEANGGKIVMPKFHIPTVGTLIFFEDTEGNVAGAMQFEAGNNDNAD